MADAVISIPLSNIIDSARFVPLAQRPALLATLLVGARGYASLFAEATGGASSHDDGPRSVCLNAAQARKLKDKIFPATMRVIKAAVSNTGATVGTVDWSQVKELTGFKNWTEFEEGQLAHLNRVLRSLEGVPAGAVLLWRDTGCIEDGKGDHSVGTLAIDGPVVHVLRSVLKIDKPNEAKHRRG